MWLCLKKILVCLRKPDSSFSWYVPEIANLWLRFSRVPWIKESRKCCSAWATLPCSNERVIAYLRKEQPRFTTSKNVSRLEEREGWAEGAQRMLRAVKPLYVVLEWQRPVIHLSPTTPLQRKESLQGLHPNETQSRVYMCVWLKCRGGQDGI